MIIQRTLDDLGEPLAIGGTAEVYDWASGWVLKLYFDRFGEDAAVYERRIAVAVAESDLPMPAVGDIVSVEDRTGLLYRHVEGAAMLSGISSGPAELEKQACSLAELHVMLHEKPILFEMPRMHARLISKLNAAQSLSPQLRTAALTGLDKLPTGNRLCHGDFHPGNILLGSAGPCIIDWVDATIGNPLADVARTSIIALGAASLDDMPHQQFQIRRLHEIYLDRYFELRPGGYEEYRRWLPIVAAARLSESVPGWDEWLLAQANVLLTDNQLGGGQPE